MVNTAILHLTHHWDDQRNSSAIWGPTFSVNFFATGFFYFYDKAKVLYSKSLITFQNINIIYGYARFFITSRPDFIGHNPIILRFKALFHAITKLFCFFFRHQKHTATPSFLPKAFLHDNVVWLSKFKISKPFRSGCWT